MIVLEMLLGMLEFLLFHETTEVKKDVSLKEGRRMERMETMGMKEEHELNIGWKEEVFGMHFYCSRITQDISFFCLFRDKRSGDETCVEGSRNKQSV